MRRPFVASAYPLTQILGRARAAERPLDAAAWAAGLRLRGRRRGLGEEGGRAGGRAGGPGGRAGGRAGRAGGRAGPGGRPGRRGARTTKRTRSTFPCHNQRKVERAEPLLRRGRRVRPSLALTNERSYASRIRPARPPQPPAANPNRTEPDTHVVALCSRRTNASGVHRHGIWMSATPTSSVATPVSRTADSGRRGRRKRP
jgi:hypothetical protein